MFREELFCIAKDCCVPLKIVLCRERLLYIQLNIELCFALVGHRTFHFKDVIPIFLGLQTLWPYSVKKPDFFRF